MPGSPLQTHTHPAALVNLAGWEIADHFGEPDAEAIAVAGGVGVLDRSERGRLAVRGEQAAAWLNRQVTNDTSRLGAGQSLRALLLNIKGRITCDLNVHGWGDELLLTTAFDTADYLADTLGRMILYGDRILLADRRSELVQLQVHGPQAGPLLVELVGPEVGKLECWSNTTVGEVLVARTDELGLPGYSLFAPAKTGPELWSKLSQQARPFGWAASEILRLEAGRPRWGAELSPDVLVMETGLSEAVSHTKGCYPGQEVTARMRDRGHANRMLRQLSLEGDAVPARDAELRAEPDGKAIGLLTSARRSPTRGVLALGYVRREQAQPGTVLLVQAGEGWLEATVQGA